MAYRHGLKGLNMNYSFNPDELVDVPVASIDIDDNGFITVNATNNMGEIETIIISPEHAKASSNVKPIYIG